MSGRGLGAGQWAPGQQVISCPRCQACPGIGRLSSTQAGGPAWQGSGAASLWLAGRSSRSPLGDDRQQISEQTQVTAVDRSQSRPRSPLGGRQQISEQTWVVTPSFPCT